MKAMILLSLLPLAFSSCTPVTSSVKKASEPVQSLARKNIARLKQLSLPGRARTRSKTPPVVAVRHEDLREVPTGREKARAWARSREEARVVSMSVDFDPDSLASGMPLPTTGILPSLGPTDSAPAPDEEADLPELSRRDFDGEAAE